MWPTVCDEPRLIVLMVETHCHRTVYCVVVTTCRLLGIRYMITERALTAR